MHIQSIFNVVFVLSARFFLLTDNNYQQHNAVQIRNCFFLGRNLYKTILQTAILTTGTLCSSPFNLIV